MLSVDSVTKRFERGKPPAVDDVSFAVEKGKVCGLLGHNGAGKSTLLGVVLGMVHPDAGGVSVDGVPVQREREKALRKIGAVFEAPAFYEYLSGYHNLRMLVSLSGGVSRKELEETVEWVGLSGRIRDRVSTYSHGMRQRLALAQALLPRPELLVLDEPTDGLDPEGIVEFREKVLEMRDRLGLTVLLSSHLLAEVEQVCDEVVIVRGGKKVHEGPVRGVAGDQRAFAIEAEDGVKLAAAWQELGGEISSGTFLHSDNTSSADLLAELVGKGVRVGSFAEKKDTLEALYLRFGTKAGKEEA